MAYRLSSLLARWVIVLTLLAIPLSAHIPDQTSSLENDLQVRLSTTRSNSTLEVDIGLDVPDLTPGYVILCPALFKEECIPLARHRTEMGLPTSIYGLEDIHQNTTGRDLRERVHNFLIDLRNENPSLQWLLIMGDSEYLRPMELWHYAEDRSQPFENTYHSDVYYAGLDSDWDDDGDGKYGEVYFNGYVEADTDWDLYVGRVPASTEQDVTDYVSKLITYEKNPPVGTWMKRFQNWGSVMEPPNRVDVPNDPNNYFAYKSNAYKVCKRVNEHLPEHIVLEELYDYPQLEPGNYSVDDGKDTLNRQNMLSQFNSGASMLNFAGQARYQAYALNDYGPPYGDGYTYTWNEPMTYQDPGNFTNGGMLPLMYASTCDTAKFFQTGYWEDKSLETWVTAGNGGVIGLISSTNVSARGEQKNKSWGNWYLDEEFWRLFFEEGETRPGKTVYRLKEIYEKEWYSPTLQIKETIMGTIYAYILLGEPYVDIYTDIAGRFPSATGDSIDIYQGNHSVRFRVEDRNGDPVPNARVNLYSHSTYSTFTADGEGWIDRTFNPEGDDLINVTFSAHNMVTADFQVVVKEEIADMVIEEGSLIVTPLPEEHGDNVTVEFNVSNHGGMTAVGSLVKVESSFDAGANWSVVEVIDLGDVASGERKKVSYDHSAHAGPETLRFTIISASSEIDLHNNEIEVFFDIPEPRFIFEPGTGAIRPANVVRPDSEISVEYDIYNEGPAAGNLALQVFLGDPYSNGTPLTGILEHGRIGSNSWGNGSIDIECPEETSLIYIVMDPEGEYRQHITDEPVRSLLEINLKPRVTRNLSMIMLEDSRENSIRIDDAFDDVDNITLDMRYSLGSIENISVSLRQEENGTFIDMTPSENWFGNSTLAVIADDGLGGVREEIEISVLPVNDPPYFTNLQGGQIRLTMVEDSPFSIFIQADDIEGDSIMYSIEDAPFDLDPLTGELIWEPGQEHVGISSWEIEIDDGNGGITTSTLVIEVLPHNDPPEVTGIVDVKVEFKGSARMDFSVTDEENDEITVTASHDFVDILRNELLVIEWEGGYEGSVNVTLEISDGINTIYASFLVEFAQRPEDEVSGEGDRLLPENIMIGAGIAVVVFAVLLILFLMLRRKDVSDRVIEEKNEADGLFLERTSYPEE